MKTRRQFFKDIGLFTILAGAGRVWKATIEVDPGYRNFATLVAIRDEFIRRFPFRPYPFIPTFQDFLREHPPSETELIADLFAKPTVWPPNMGETQRRIILPNDQLRTL